jgi:hypothetical protein
VIVDLILDFSHFVTSMTAPIASGWSVCRVGLAPTGKRRLVTAHTRTRHPRAEAVSRTAQRSGQAITLVLAGFIAPTNDPMALDAAEDDRARNMH